jgi:geranylgeranyl diphosphate synthase, type I
VQGKDRKGSTSPVAELFEERLRQLVLSYDGSSPIYTMIRYHFGYGDETVRRGKRLRSHLLLRVVQEEGATVEAGLDAAVAIEILHNYSLVHDDIEDRDALRHGHPTVWAKYGIPHGVNVGDSMCAMAYLAILTNQYRHPADRIALMTHKLHEANLNMCGGQGLDISFESAAMVSMNQYLEMVEGKTAALFRASCELGALSAGADVVRAERYGDLGRAYGLAFQVRDDVLGTWGSPEQTGKPSGADIANRKWSFPVVWALSGESSSARSEIAKRYARGSAFDESDVSAIISALDVLGARAAADAACERHLAEANRIAHEAQLDRSGAVRDFLTLSAQRVA